MEKFKQKRHCEWVFIYEDSKPIIRMNDADFETDEEMNNYVEWIINLLNENSKQKPQ